MQMTLPELFAIANGKTYLGEYRCRFCGSPASQPHKLADTFTAIDSLTDPLSNYACVGCLLCLEEIGDVNLPDGKTLAMTRSYRRGCSWVITQDSCVGATKAHIQFLRETCLNPPEPPFAISIAVSGQKHTLYRGVVCHSRENMVVTLEGEKVEYHIDELKDRLNLCGHLIAATGKPALEEKPDAFFWGRVAQRYTHWEELLSQWEEVRESPLSRLAVFLSPKKEDCERAFTDSLAG